MDGFLSELEPEIRWERAEYQYENIELYVADIIGLLKSKVKAVHDGGLVQRSTDKKDMLSLLRLINITNIQELYKEESLKFIEEKYKRTYQYLKDVSDW